MFCSYLKRVASFHIANPKDSPSRAKVQDWLDQNKTLGEDVSVEVDPISEDEEGQLLGKMSMISVQIFLSYISLLLKIARLLIDLLSFRPTGE